MKLVGSLNFPKAIHTVGAVFFGRKKFFRFCKCIHFRKSYSCEKFQTLLAIAISYSIMFKNATNTSIQFLSQFAKV